MKDPVELKLIEILRILHESKKPIGARTISDILHERGYPLGERAVRYHLRILDERGLTKREGYAGRSLTEKGEQELKNALVGARLGFIITRIEELIYQTDLDLETGRGKVIVNTSIIDKNDFEAALEIMREVASAGYVTSPHFHVIEEEEGLGDIYIPEGRLGIATLCSITIDGILLKNGIPSITRFGGTLEIKDGKPRAFQDLISYSGTTLDPIKICLSRRMTSISSVLETGNGLVLANLRDIPVSALSEAKKVLETTRKHSVNGVIKPIERSIPGAPISRQKVGIVIYAGINMMVAVEEKGIPVENHPVSNLLKLEEMKKL